MKWVEVGQLTEIEISSPSRSQGLSFLRINARCFDKVSSAHYQSAFDSTGRLKVYYVGSYLARWSTRSSLLQTA